MLTELIVVTLDIAGSHKIRTFQLHFMFIYIHLTVVCLISHVHIRWYYNVVIVAKIYVKVILLWNIIF